MFTEECRMHHLKQPSKQSSMVSIMSSTVQEEIQPLQGSWLAQEETSGKSRREVSSSVFLACPQVVNPLNCRSVSNPGNTFRDLEFKYVEMYTRQEKEVIWFVGCGSRGTLFVALSKTPTRHTHARTEDNVYVLMFQAF